MTFINRLRSFFFPSDPFASQVTPSVAALPVTTADISVDSILPQNPGLPVFSHQITSEPIPYWLADEDSLRDEGVLFGLSNARPDEKIAEIRAYFAQQAEALDRLIEYYSEKISELNLVIEQRKSRSADLLNRVNELRDNQPTETNLIRPGVSLVLSIVMCIGNFYLIDETLQPVFPNHWIAVGVFLAGMFNIVGRTSFFYEEGTRLTGRRFVEEVGLPLAASVFVMAQALQNQSFWQAVALFVFVFFLFLLAGKLLLTTLTLLQNGVTAIDKNRRLVIDKQQNLPRWEAEIDRLHREIDTVRAQKWPVVTAMNTTETELARLNIKRDQLVNLFLSEFELAHSLRDRLTDQQRKSILNYGTN